MKYFNQFYLDKEKDIVVRLDYDNNHMYYTIYVDNYKTDNLIHNLASISKQKTQFINNKTVIHGEVPCYIKGDGQRVYILRLNGTKLANIYPNGKIEVNSLIPSIAKTLMSQTKDYQYSFRETLLKSYVLDKIKLKTDLHTHGNANLNADCLIALAIKHQIQYPMYYIKKLNLVLSEKQWENLLSCRRDVEKSLDLEGLYGKYRERMIDDHTYINFADLILNNIDNSFDNINKIRLSLTLLKDSQAVFTNLEKLYLYRYVFTKGQVSNNKIVLDNIDKIVDKDIYNYLVKMLEDNDCDDYRNNTLYEDTLLWIGREYQKRHIEYVEISDTTLVKKDISCVHMLKQVHRILPLVKKETGVDIRFLAAIRRIPLTLVKHSIVSDNYLNEAIEALKVTCLDPYVVGSDFVGEEINDISELKYVIKEIVREIAYYDKDWTIRIHAGENDTLKNNMLKSIELIEESLFDNQAFPFMRIGHGLYCAPLKSKKGQYLLNKINEHHIVLEFQLTSNVRLNNIIDLKKHPLKTYLNHHISCVMGTDGYGLYGTDSIDEQLALMNFLKIYDDEFMLMKRVEDNIIERNRCYFIDKSYKFKQLLNNRSIEDCYNKELFKNNSSSSIQFQLDKYPTYPILKDRVKDLPWDKYPIIIGGDSFSFRRLNVNDDDVYLLQMLLDSLDPKKVFFVVGHKLMGYERYIVDHKKGFDVYSIVPSLMSKKQMNRVLKSNIDGIRISTESREMGIYKSFNYEIFERRNSVLIVFGGNLSIANLIQEARNGKGKTRIYVYPHSLMLKAKARSLEGYVSVNMDVNKLVDEIRCYGEDIGERWL